MKLSFTRTLLLLLSLCITTNSFADDLNFEAQSPDWYQIEFALFEHMEGARSELRYEAHQYRPLLTKSFQYFFDMPYFESGYPLLERHFAALEDELSELSGSAKRLERDRRTQLLKFSAWQQVINNDSQTLPLKLRQELSDGRRLDGYIRVRRERYMHIEVDLFLFEPQYFVRVDWFDWVGNVTPLSIVELLRPVPPELENEENNDTKGSEKEGKLRLSGNDFAPAWSPNQSDATLESDTRSMLAMNVIRFKDSRRIKESERHYLDHPALGLIASIKKIELAAKQSYENERP